MITHDSFHGNKHDFQKSLSWWPISQLCWLCSKLTVIYACLTCPLLFWKFMSWCTIMSLEYVRMCYLLAIVFHVVERKKKTQQSLARISNTAHIIEGKWKRVGLTDWGGRKHKTATHTVQPQLHHNVLGICQNVLLTRYCIPCRCEEKRKQNCMSLAMHQYWYIISACGKEWVSPSEVGGRRKQQHIANTATSQ